MRASQRTTRTDIDVCRPAGTRRAASSGAALGGELRAPSEPSSADSSDWRLALAVIGASTEIALQRHAPRSVPSGARRLRRAMAALVSLAILVLAGLLNAVLD